MASNGATDFRLDRATVSFPFYYVTKTMRNDLTKDRFTWSIEMTYFTPHLLQFGLAKSQTSLVWIAPPLSGLIVQPIIGVVSDSSRLRWGRRRPYMMISSILVAIFLCILAWSAEIIKAFSQKPEVTDRLTVALAIFCIYAVDFSINAMQATARSLIVDTLPGSQQQQGSAWAGRMLGLGHMLGYLVGTVDLMKYTGKWFGDSQFKQVCMVASFTIVSCTAVTCFCVTEVVLTSRAEGNGRSTIWKMFSTVLATTMHLPNKIQAVCWITFWSWIGWSPFFVYGTTWVGETYYRENAAKVQELKTSKDVVGDIARKGSSALVLFSLVSFAGSFFLPWVVENPSSDMRYQTSVRNPPCRYRTDLNMAWGLSQMAFAGAMILTPFSRSFQFATILITFCGIPWAMYGWAPLAIMGEEINRLENPGNSYVSVPQNQANDHEFSNLPTSPHHAETVTATTNHEDAHDLPTAGVYLGILNIFATVPQFLATFIAMIVFSILEPGRSLALAQGGSEGGNQDVRAQAPVVDGTAVCLVIGGVCSIIAALHTFRLRRAGK